MANEITIQAKLQANKNNVLATNQVSQKIQNMQSTIQKMLHNTQSVGTSAEDLVTGDVDLTKEHMVLLFNRDATNYVDVQVRKDAVPTDTSVGRMRPGEPWGPVRMPAQSGGYPKLRLTANTAACDVEVVVCDAGDPSL